MNGVPATASFDPSTVLRHLPRTAMLTDTAVMTKRNLVRLLRTPQLLFFATVQPVMFVLLFTYVFGGSISVPGLRYIDYLIPGIFVQTVAFGGVNTAVGLSTDLGSGIIDRFRSLPMARAAVLAGRTIADGVRNLFVVLLMVVVGTLVGFRFHNGFVPAVGAIGLVLLFGFSLAWLFALIGMTLKETETAQVAGLVVIFPLTFVSGAFTPISSMPSWLRIVARNQPFTHMVNSMRGLTQGGAVAHSVLMALVWMAGTTVIFAALAVRRYRRG